MKDRKAYMKAYAEQYRLDGYSAARHRRYYERHKEERRADAAARRRGQRLKLKQ